MPSCRSGSQQFPARHLCEPSFEQSMKHTWYVTFEVQKRGTLPRPRHPRLTQGFATEAEAQAFAREKFDQGLVVTAGTLNPYSPKQTIPASSIPGWLGIEPVQKGEATDGANE